MRTFRHNAESGLTLIEIMIVLIILATLMTFLGQRLFGARDKANLNLTNMKLQSLKQDIEMFRMQYNSLPSSLNDLTGCPDKAGEDCVPVTSSEDAVKDGWDSPLVYELTNNSRAYMIKSLGADGREGGSGFDKDISMEGP